MAVIRIRRKIESETLELPELKVFLGKTVEIHVTEDESAASTDPWSQAEQALSELSGFDFEALEKQHHLDQLQSRTPVA
jgi:hypothetical protein